MKEDIGTMEERSQAEYRKGLMVTTIQEAHAGQFRNGGKVPYWYHCQNAALIMEGALAQSQELRIAEPLAVDMYLAALGHDLYEDTKVKPDQIRKQFGERVNQYIEYMTNEQGDDNREQYLGKIRNAPEEVRLIKLGDAIDNLLGAAYGIHDMGVSWTEDFFLPLISETRDVLKSSSFTKYPKTANLLLGQLDFSFQRLNQNLNNFKHNKKDDMEDNIGSNSTQTTTPTPQGVGGESSPSNQLFLDMMRQNEQVIEQRRKELGKVKAEASDKEPFDIHKFARMHDITNDQGQLDITPELIERYEMEYYLDQSGIKTLEDFARHREEMDKNDAG